MSGYAWFRWINTKSPTPWDSGSIGLRFVLQARPSHKCLICDFCSSGRGFAYSFLQIPPLDGHPCLWLSVPNAMPVTGFHRRVIAHAGHTKKRALTLLRAPWLALCYSPVTSGRGSPLESEAESCLKYTVSDLGR
jgi:hypothetical protein